MANPETVQEHFDRLYAEWEDRIKDPKIQVSSRPQDYTNVEPYREIVNLGRDALPLVLEKIAAGVFLMNDAALQMTDTRIEDIVVKEKALPQAERIDFAVEKVPPFLSEQQKSQLILRHLQQE